MPSLTTADVAHLPLALTLGEPAGIGPEITLKAWRDRETSGLPPFLVVAPPAIMEETAHTLALTCPIARVTSPAEAMSVFATALPVLAVDGGGTVRAGHPTTATAPAVIQSIRTAVSMALEGQVAGIVTNPIQKSVLYDSGFGHPGHTEFLAELCATGGVTPTPVMMLAVPGLRVVPVTVHIPLADVATRLGTHRIVALGRVVARALHDDFGIENPRLAVAGLNPHAGEDGQLGGEEQTIIAPAIAALAAEGIAVSGPFPADSLFHRTARARYDAAICMYHDQALIPLKTIDFDHGVNVTLGLPIVRTSPDHGTALDIAGRGTASAESLIAAIRMAAEMACARKARHNR